jgi:hypothetical protein
MSIFPAALTYRFAVLQATLARFLDREKGFTKFRRNVAEIDWHAGCAAL